MRSLPLILVPASLRDLHRHSCQHFHFSSLAFFAPSYPHFVSQWISFLSSPPSRTRAPLYVLYLPLFSFPRVLYFSFLFFFSSFFLAARIFFSHDAVEYARSCQTQRADPRSSIFRESSSSLRPLWGVSSETSGEREDFLSTAPREIDELPRDRTERQKENTTKKCKVSRAHSKHRRLRSYAARFQRLGRRRFHWTGKSQFAGCPKTGPPTTARPDQNRINNKLNDLGKSEKMLKTKTWKKFLKMFVAKKVTFKKLLLHILLYNYVQL